MNQKLKTLQLIHLSLCGGVIISYFLVGNIVDRVKEFDFNSINYLYLGIPIAAIILSMLAFHVQLKKIDKTRSAEENLALYQTASLVRWAILEGIAFLLLFYIPELMVFGIPIVAYLFFLIPTEERVNADLQKV